MTAEMIRALPAAVSSQTCQLTRLGLTGEREEVELHGVLG